VLSISVLELAKYMTATVPRNPAKRIRMMIIARHDFMKVTLMMKSDPSS
jgi:hypothetical protein